YYSFYSLPSHPTPPNSGAYYFAMEVTHQLNEFVNVHLEAGRQLRLGVGSNLIDLWYVRPRLGLRIFEKLTVVPSMVYEQGTDTGNSVNLPNERYTLLGGGIGASCHLMEKMMLSLGYEYTVKNSDVPAFNYHRNRVILQAQYTF